MFLVSENPNDLGNIYLAISNIGETKYLIKLNEGLDLLWAVKTPSSSDYFTTVFEILPYSSLYVVSTSNSGAVLNFSTL